MQELSRTDTLLVLQQHGFVGSGPTLDLAVADAHDRARLDIGTYVRWEYSSFTFHLLLSNVSVGGSCGKYDYDNAAPSITATFVLTASVRL